MARFRRPPETGPMSKEHSQACFDVRTQRCVCGIDNPEPGKSLIGAIEEWMAVIPKVPEMVAMLRKLEWCGGGEGPSECPECVAYKTTVGDPRPGYGMHDAGCALDTLLKALP